MKLTIKIRIKFKGKCYFFRKIALNNFQDTSWQVLIAWFICSLSIFQSYILELWQIVHCDWLLFILEEFLMLFF